MLDKINLNRKVTKEEFKKVKDDLVLKLGALQRRARELRIPVMIVFEGWEAAGKGTLINNLILPLDPRGFNVYNILPPDANESLYPFLWRFWKLTPAAGRMAIYDRSWYREVLDGKVLGETREQAVEQAYQDICSFEEQLADDGAVIIKLFLHISKKVQKRRFDKLSANSATSWRVTKEDWKSHKRYGDMLEACEEMVAATDNDFAPWTIVEAHNQRFATVKIFNIVINSLEKAITKLEKEAQPVKNAKKAIGKPVDDGGILIPSMLDNVDLTKRLERESYRRKLRELQIELRDLEYKIYKKRIPVLVLYEGWDAGGKGGNIRRLTQKLDPRGYEVVPVAAPNDIEKAHHYLWRFWTCVPKGGHIAIFDRTWYGRVLVERVEGFCSEEEWRRAYREINEMERHLANFGAVVVKFWIHIDKDEQLRRFEERQKTDYKKWKITDEDWRNREKWGQYKSAIEEMLFRTSTPFAQWHVIEGNDKYHARVKALDIVSKAIKKAL